MLTSFEWNVKELKVQTRNKGSLTILRDIAGRANKGTLTAILGPSGAGKSSLLGCLTLRTQNFTGALRLNGKPLTNDYFWQMGYVHQDALFFSYLTPQEHLTFHAITRLSHALSREKCQERVETVLNEMDLTHVAGTYIGGNELFVAKGLSGGERKRLNIATELLARPSLLLLDEPTSGLDSVMAKLICLLLESLAKGPEKRIIIAAIHAPSSELFTLFTHLTLLTGDGRLAYAGPRDKLLGFFEGLGHACPHHFNPADFALQLVSSKTGEALDDDTKGDMVKTPLLAPSPTVLEMGDAWRHEPDSSSRIHSTERGLQQHDEDKHMVRKTGSRTSFWILFKMNLWRGWLLEIRDRAIILTLGSTSVILGLFWGLMYFRRLQGDPQNTIGFIFMVCGTLLIISGGHVCMQFPLESAIVRREQYTDANTPAAYFWGRTTAAIPLSMTMLVMGIIPYPMTGLTMSFDMIASYCLVLALLNFGAQSLGYIASSLHTNPILVAAILPVLNAPHHVFGGYLYPRLSMHAPLQWIQSGSIIYYSLGFLSINESRNMPDKVQKGVLRFLQLDISDLHPFLLKLALLAASYRMLAFFAFLVRNRVLDKA